MRFLRQIPRARLYLTITVICGTLLGVLVVFQAFSLSQIIDGVFLHKQTLQQVERLMLFLIGVIVLRGLGIDPNLEGTQTWKLSQ